VWCATASRSGLSAASPELAGIAADDVRALQTVVEGTARADRRSEAGSNPRLPCRREQAVEMTLAAIAIAAGMRVDALARIPLSYPTYAGILTCMAADASSRLDPTAGRTINRTAATAQRVIEQVPRRGHDRRRRRRPREKPTLVSR